MFVSISYSLTSCHHHLLFFLLPPSGLSLLLLLLLLSLQFRTPSHQFIQRPPCVQVPRHVWQNNLRPSNFCGVERCRCQDQTLDAKQNGESKITPAHIRHALSQDQELSFLERSIKPIFKVYTCDEEQITCISIDAFNKSC